MAESRLWSLLRGAAETLGFGGRAERSTLEAAEDLARTPPRAPATPTADEIRARNQARIEQDEVLRRFNERMEARARGETPPRSTTETPPRAATEPHPNATPQQPPLWNPNQGFWQNVAGMGMQVVPRVWRSGLAGKAAIIGGGLLAAPHWLGTHIGSLMATFHNVPGLGPFLQSASNFFPAVAEGYSTALNTSAAERIKIQPLNESIRQMRERTAPITVPQPGQIEGPTPQNPDRRSLRGTGLPATDASRTAANMGLNSLTPFAAPNAPHPNGP